MKFYKVKVYFNGVKVLNLGNDTNDSLSIILDRIQNGIKLKEETFYQFNIYEGDDNIAAKGILSTRSGHLHLEDVNKFFERCFICDKNYNIFISESTDIIIVINIKYKIVPIFMEGKQKFIDWIYMYRLHIDKFMINEREFEDLDLAEIKNSLNAKVNNVIIETK